MHWKDAAAARWMVVAARVCWMVEAEARLDGGGSGSMLGKGIHDLDVAVRGSVDRAAVGLRRQGPWPRMR